MKIEYKKQAPGFLKKPKSDFKEVRQLEKLSYRLRYDASICDNHYSNYTISDLVYMCQWYGVISSREIAVALGRTQGAILKKVHNLKESGDFEYFKTLLL